MLLPLLSLQTHVSPLVASGIHKPALVLFPSSEPVQSSWTNLIYHSWLSWYGCGLGINNILRVMSVNGLFPSTRGLGRCRLSLGWVLPPRAFPGRVFGPERWLPAPSAAIAGKTTYKIEQSIKLSRGSASDVGAQSPAAWEGCSI